MSWYIIICALFSMVYIFKNIQSGKGHEIKGLLSCIIILWFFAFARDYSVGADTKNYVALIEQLRNCSLLELARTRVYNWRGTYVVRWEYGFKLLIWVLANTIGYISVRSVIAGYSLLILILLYKTINRESPYPIMSIWLYLTLGFFQTSLNMSQNALAIVIALWSLRYIEEKQLYKWIIAICIATTIHYSSILFIPLYWVGNIRFTRRKSIIFFFSAAVVFFTFERILVYFVRFVPYQYVNYIRTNVSASKEVFVLILHLIIFSAVIICANFKKMNKAVKGYIKNDIEEEQDRFSVYLSPYYVIFLLEIVSYLLSIHAKGLLRVATLFSPAIILYIPRLIGNISNIRLRNHAIILVVFISLIGYIIRLLINNIGLTQPYIFGF